MGFRANPHYSDPSIGAIAQNLGSALFGDPASNERRRLLQSQVELNSAKTGEVDDGIARARRQDEALRGLGGLFEDALTAEAAGPNIDGTAGYRVARSPQETRNIFASRIGDITTAYRDKPGAIGELFRTLGAMSGDDGLARQGMVASGHTPSRDFALTPERADGISARDAGEAFAQATGVANINNAGAMERERLQERGRNERNGANVAAGAERTRLAAEARVRAAEIRATIARSGGNPLNGVKADTALAMLKDAEESGDPARVEEVRRMIVAPSVVVGAGNNATSAANTAATVAGAGARNDATIAGANARNDANNAAAGERSAARNQTAIDVAAARGTGRNGRLTPDDVNMPPKQTAEIEGQIAKRLGVSDLAGAFEHLGADEKAEFAHAISSAYAKDGKKNGPAALAAGEAYLRSKINVETSMIPFVSPSVRRRPETTAPAAPGAGAAFSGAPAAAPSNVPPAASRERGKVYETPRGPMEWTGTGWIPAVSQ